MAVYKCAGRFRIDPDTDESVCSYESTTAWKRRCPGCHGPYSCDKIGVERSTKQRRTAADSLNPNVGHVYIPTNVALIDSVLTSASGSGVVKSQVILFGGAAGARKTSLVLRALEGLCKETNRKMVYASAEQNLDDAIAMCKLNGVTSPQIELRANDSSVHIEDILQHCEESRAFAAAFDSLQVIAKRSGMTSEDVAERIVAYSKKSKMISFIIAHLTKGMDFKGGTGAPYLVDTMLMAEPYVPKVDGDPVKVFGSSVVKRVITTFDPDDDDAYDFKIPGLITLVGGWDGKNRYGTIEQKSYYYSPLNGDVVPLKVKSKVIDLFG